LNVEGKPVIALAGASGDLGANVRALIGSDMSTGARTRLQEIDLMPAAVRFLDRSRTLISTKRRESSHVHRNHTIST
jgi:hypothetical protein